MLSEDMSGETDNGMTDHHVNDHLANNLKLTPVGPSSQNNTNGDSTERVVS